MSSLIFNNVKRKWSWPSFAAASNAGTSLLVKKSKMYTRGTTSTGHFAALRFLASLRALSEETHTRSTRDKWYLVRA